MPILLLGWINLAAAETVLQIGSLQASENTATKQVLQEAYKRLNIPISFIFLPAERSLHLANEGAIDGEDSRLEGLEKTYPNLLRVKIPLEIVLLYAYSKNPNLILQGWESLRPYRIAYLRGVKVIEKNLGGFNTEAVSEITQAFMMLETNRVDVVIADDHQAAHVAVNYKNITKLNSPVYSFPVYHYVHKKHADLVPKLEAVLQQMLENKTLEPRPQ